MSVEVEVVADEEVVHSIVRKVKHSFDDATALASFDHTCFGALSQEQSYGSDENTLTCARLARNHGEAAVEIDVELFDERVVLDGK
jgi:hypothetical protein